MSEKTDVFQHAAAEALQYLVDYGWQQDGMGYDGGPRCLYGALISIADNLGATVMADHLELYLSMPSLIGWNDRRGRTKEEVLGLLQDYAEGRLV